MGKKRKQKTKQPRTAPTSNESQRAEAITVFWMMSLLVTVLSTVAALIARLFVVFVDAYPALLLMTSLLLFISCVTGVLCLGILPLVLRWRKAAPPTAIVRFAIAASVLPLLIAVVVFLTQN